MNEALVQAAAQVVVAGVWQGCLVAGAVWVCLAWLPRISAAQRFAVWATAFALVLVLPFLSLMRGAGDGVSSGLHVGAGWAVAVAMLWAAAMGWRGIELVRQALRVRQIWLAARPVEVPASVSALLMDCPRQPRMFISDDVTAPSVIGFFAPRLLMPAGMLAQSSEAELQQIVLHECEHLRRGDDWLNLLQKLALAVFPLHFALVWMDRRLGLERELACDAGVIAATGAPIDYAACLARLAEHRMSGGRLALAVSAWAGQSELGRRVQTLLDPVLRSRRGSRLAMTAMAGVLVVVAGGVSRVPQFVSFAGPAAVAVAEPVMAAPAEAMVPVVFHMPADAAPLQVVHKVSRRVVRVRTVRRRTALASTPRVYATRYEVRSPRPAGAMVEVGFSYSYAAVPFGDGWLIVQL